MDNRIEVKFSNSPELITFVFHPSGEVFHFSGSIKGFNLCDDHDNMVKAHNIDEWIRRKTNNIHNFTTLQDAASSFRNGVKYNYSFNDIKLCAELTFKTVMNLLYNRGYASKYATIYDIESTPIYDVKAKIRSDLKANRYNLDQNRINRMVNLCECLDFQDVGTVLSKVANFAKTSKEIDSSDLDNEIHRAIELIISRKFVKHKLYEQL